MLPDTRIYAIKNNIIMTNKIKELVDRVSGEDISIVSNLPHHVKLRKIYYQLCKDFLPRISLEKIGIAVGRNHSTVLGQLRKFYEIETEKKYLNIYNECKAILSSNEPEFKKQLKERENFLIQIEHLKNENIDLKLKAHLLEKQHETLYNGTRYQSIIELIRNLSDTNLEELEKYRIIPFIKLKTIKL